MSFCPHLVPGWRLHDCARRCEYVVANRCAVRDNMQMRCVYYIRAAVRPSHATEIVVSCGRVVSKRLSSFGDVGRFALTRVLILIT